MIPAVGLAGWAAADAGLDRLLGADRRWLEIASSGLFVAAVGMLLVEDMR